MIKATLLDFFTFLKKTDDNQIELSNKNKFNFL
jgi:hypothetical protein